MKPPIYAIRTALEALQKNIANKTYMAASMSGVDCLYVGDKWKEAANELENWLGNFRQAEEEEEDVEIDFPDELLRKVLSDETTPEVHFGGINSLTNQKTQKPTRLMFVDEDKNCHEVTVFLDSSLSVSNALKKKLKESEFMTMLYYNKAEDTNCVMLRNTRNIKSFIISEK